MEEAETTEFTAEERSRRQSPARLQSQTPTIEGVPDGFSVSIDSTRACWPGSLSPRSQRRGRWGARRLPSATRAATRSSEKRSMKVHANARRRSKASVERPSRSRLRSLKSRSGSIRDTRSSTRSGSSRPSARSGGRSSSIRTRRCPIGGWHVPPMAIAPAHSCGRRRAGNSAARSASAITSPRGKCNTRRASRATPRARTSSTRSSA